MVSSLNLQVMFAAFPVVIVVIAAVAAKSQTFFFGALAILLATAGLALSGMLADFEARPPRLLLLLAPLATIVGFAACSSIGSTFVSLPLAWLVGFQAFRLPLELMIHEAVLEGVAPPQFTWTGLNYDIVVGIVSIMLAPLASRSPKWVIWCWTALGLGLLFNVVSVAILSTPGPQQLLTPDNRWVAYFPFVWLPAICVMAAMFGHIVVIRKLIRHPHLTN